MITVAIHTANGWVIHSDRCKSWRGAEQAKRNAIKKYGVVPWNSRVGGTDTTFALIYSSDDIPQRFERYFEFAGCAAK